MPWRSRSDVSLRAFSASQRRGRPHSGSGDSDQRRPRAGAQASSAIENIFATLDSLFSAAVDESQPADPHTRELIEILVRQPYCKIAFVVEAGIAKRQTAAAYLQALEDAGIITSETVGRERLFLNPALLELLKSGKL